MSVIISGTNGIQNVLGSASAPADTNTTTPTTGVYYPSATTWGVSTAGTNALYIDTSQNVGIGVSNPNSYGSNVNVVSSKSFVAGGAATGYGFYPYYVSSTNYAAILGDSSGAMTFTTGTTSPSERMRIDTSGNLLVGTTSQLGSLSSKINFTFTGTTSTYGATSKPSADNSYHYVFLNAAGAAVGSIATTSTATTYAVSSDYRLKENVTPITTGLEKISALKPVNYDWINTKEQGEGFIAHELQDVVPLAVFGEKDAIDANGNPIHQGVDYSKIVVHLVAAIQELSAKVDAQAAEITTLKAKVGA